MIIRMSKQVCLFQKSAKLYLHIYALQRLVQKLDKLMKSSNIEQSPESGISEFTNNKPINKGESKEQNM